MPINRTGISNQVTKGRRITKKRKRPRRGRVRTSNPKTKKQARRP